MTRGVYQSPSGALFGFIVDPKTERWTTFRMTVSGKEEFLRLLLDCSLPQEQKSNIMKMIDDDFKELLKRKEEQRTPRTPKVSKRKTPTS